LRGGKESICLVEQPALQLLQLSLNLNGRAFRRRQLDLEPTLLTLQRADSCFALGAQSP